jgi:hypothetical protein
VDRFALIQMLVLVALAGLAAHATVRWRSGMPPGHHGFLVARNQPSGRVGADNVTSTEAAWFVRLRVEQRRHQRHGRTATIVAMHLGGPTGALGRRAARRRAQDVWRARRIETALRSTDIVRAGSDGIVRILLTETDEEGGDACVRRLAERLPGWAAEVGAAGHLSAAWAATRTGRDLWAANRLAIARLRGVQAGWLRSGSVHLDGDGPFSRFVATGQAATGAAPAGESSGVVVAARSVGRLSTQTLADGVVDQRRGTAGAELARQVRHMTADGVGADPQSPANFG